MKEKKTFIWLLSRKHIKSENCARKHLSSNVFHSLENFEVGPILCAECYGACIFREISAKKKKIASTSYTWLPFNYCQTIRCGLFISFNVVDLMQCNSGSSWSCSHIQHRVLFSPSSSFFYSPERIKSTSAFKEQLFSVPHPKTSRLPQWITSDFSSLLWQQKKWVFLHSSKEF